MVEVVMDDGNSWFQAGKFNSKSSFPYVVVNRRPVPISAMYGSLDMVGMIDYIRDTNNLDDSVRVIPCAFVSDELGRFPSFINQMPKYRYTEKFLDRVINPIDIHETIPMHLYHFHVAKVETLFEFPNYFIGKSNTTTITIDVNEWSEIVRQDWATEKMTVATIYGENYPK